MFNLKIGWSTIIPIILHLCLIAGCNFFDSGAHTSISSEKGGLEYIYQFKPQEALEEVNEIDSKPIQVALREQINYLVNGSYNDSLVKALLLSELSPREKFHVNLSYSNYLLWVQNNDNSLVFQLLMDADSIEFQESASLRKYLERSFLSFYLNNHDSEKLRKAYISHIESYADYVESDTDQFWLIYYKIHSYLLSVFYDEESLDEKGIDFLFEKLKSTSGVSDYLRGRAYQLEGVYENLIKKESEKAKSTNVEAMAFYNKSNLFLAHKALYGLELNQANSFRDSGQLDAALPLYHKVLSDLSNQNLLLKRKTNVTKALSWCYKLMEQHDSSRFYLAESIRYEKRYNDFVINQDVVQLEFQSDLKKKEKELKRLSSKTRNQSRQIWLLLPYAFILSGLAFFIYKRFIRAKKEKSILEKDFEEAANEKIQLERSYQEILEREQSLQQEKEQTIERLKELKDVVTKEFITLQDKTKVYLEELMFIQSDDHYLKVHLFEKKENFVRGKLSQLMKELPPNFKRCHRSYIVNENYIRTLNAKSIILVDESEIPLSKTYKDDF